jgi:hypothetical protein
VLVDAQLQMIYRRKAETQALPANVLVGVLAPLLGLERFPQRDGLAGGVTTTHPDEPPQVGQNRGWYLAGEYIGRGRPPRQPDEVTEIGPHDLGPKHAAICCTLPQRFVHQPLEVRRAPVGVAPGRMLGVPATILAQDVPELWIAEERPHFRVVGALKVVARLPLPPRLEQDLEMLFRVTGYPRVVERRAKQRTPAARRRTDQIR